MRRNTSAAKGLDQAVSPKITPVRRQLIENGRPTTTDHTPTIPPIIDELIQRGFSVKGEHEYRSSQEGVEVHGKIEYASQLSLWEHAVGVLRRHAKHFVAALLWAKRSRLVTWVLRNFHHPG